METTKLTLSQERILNLLRSHTQELSAQDIHAEFRRQHGMMGLATVYRSLRSLQLSGRVQARTLKTGESVYSLAREEHHHLTCLQCGISLPIENCPIQELEQQLEHIKNFKVYYHTLEFFGLCSPCANRPIEEA
jgi:Fur family transcriptional regulator, ferric uptake regulator